MTDEYKVYMDLLSYFITNKYNLNNSLTYINE